ncbi:hypothetical protein D3C72_1136450 [compost metagenome]
MRDSRFDMDIAHRRGQMARGFFRRFANPQPVSGIEGEGDRQFHHPAGRLETLHWRKLPAVGLIIFHYQRHPAFQQQFA